MIRGWAFDETGGTLPLLGLFVDGQRGPTIPCCSQRADVAAAFPDTANALNSGWGTVYNYNLLSPGRHTLTPAIGYYGLAILLPQHEAIVVKPGGFEFLDQFERQLRVRAGNGLALLTGHGFERVQQCFLQHFSDAAIRLLREILLKDASKWDGVL